MRSAVGLLVVTLLGPTARAYADFTAFLGVAAKPSNRTATGLSVGFGLVVVGFEFEYSSARQDETTGAPSLKTGMFNLLVQTPRISSAQIYGTIGGGFYRERLDAIEHQETNFGTNVGGGVKLGLAGPLRLRLDYRLFLLHGSPLYGRPQRFYAGLNLSF